MTGLPLRLLLTAFMLLLVFSIWPGIDLAVAGLFFRPPAGFWLNDARGLQALRIVYWDAAILMALVCSAFWLAGLRLGRSVRVDRRLWGFGALYLLIGPGVIVNGIFKAWWGRARPADVTEFGGEALFTPPFQMASQCTGNCSFVSGEGSAAVALALVAGILGWSLVPRHRRRGFVGLLAGMALIGGMLRVAMGRHFLSDVIFGGLMMAGLALLLVRILRIGTAQKTMTSTNLVHDARLLRDKLLRDDIARPILSALRTVWARLFG